ncbi:hypothetical protein C8R46DRAFT_1054320 [Mycena filopes]|nr:hypothetical protein C8R46DRAFT_1054320 [Mycena filopes]
MANIFLDPMLGTPLPLYLDPHIHDRTALVDLVTKHGGTVSQGYSGVPYILVLISIQSTPTNPLAKIYIASMQTKRENLFSTARWIRECVKAAQLQTFATNWAGCKVDGTETTPPRRKHAYRRNRSSSSNQQQQALHIDPQTHYAFQVYVPPIQVAETTAQSWQSNHPAIVPEQNHIRPAVEYRQDTPWNHYQPHDQTPAPVNPAPTQYDYTRYRDDENNWAAAGATNYYDPAYVQPYQSNYIEEDRASPEAGPSTLPPEPDPEPEPAEKPRGRKRARPTSAPTAPAASLVANRNPPARSPTPPTRVVKSTYGGNLFTADDVIYLKKYIDYCHEQGLVLSLREICERIAVKVRAEPVSGPFYSWRRYCNKHQIRLGGYTMNADRSESPNADGDDEEDNAVGQSASSTRPTGGSIHNLMHMDAAPRNRSPTPPRALFRSTTGKGVAFTDADITFLVRFMEYRRSQGKLDMVAFWKDVATKAPHHSRASWMKFWRRHKHELERTDADAPLPQPPDKKMRYSRGDDILLAKHFYNKVEGKSDQIFQAFGRMYPHHPWKGWQEHHRIHKAKIDHFIERLSNGETLEDEETVE